MIQLDPASPRGIVWLASYPKSGNTWVRAFLVTLLQSLAGSKVQAVDLEAVAYFGENDRLIAYFRRHLTEESLRDRHAVAETRPKVQADIALNSEGPVLAKTHNAMMTYQGAPLINRAVSAGAVYVVRNPLDVVISLAHFRQISLDEAIEAMETPLWSTETNEEDVYFVSGSWSENVASWTAKPSPVILAVRYEDLLAKPVEMFTLLTQHVRMPATPDQIGRTVEMTSFERMQKAETAKGFLEKPPHAERFFREGRAGQWQDVLSSTQVDRIVGAHREQMARFGYLPT